MVEITINLRRLLRNKSSRRLSRCLSKGSWMTFSRRFLDRLLWIIMGRMPNEATTSTLVEMLPKMAARPSSSRRISHGDKFRVPLVACLLVRCRIGIRPISRHRRRICRGIICRGSLISLRVPNWKITCSNTKTSQTTWKVTSTWAHCLWEILWKIVQEVVELMGRGLLANQKTKRQTKINCKSKLQL